MVTIYYTTNLHRLKRKKKIHRVFEVETQKIQKKKNCKHFNVICSIIFILHRYYIYIYIYICFILTLNNMHRYEI